MTTSTKLVSVAAALTVFALVGCGPAPASPRTEGVDAAAPAAPKTVRIGVDASHEPAGGFIIFGTEGTGWNKGGAVAWQLYDPAGNPTSEKGRADGVPVWSLVSAFAKPDGNFVIVY